MSAGSVAVVTGTSEGIGFAIAQRLASAGYQVAMVARASERLRDAAAEIGSGAFAVAADLGRLEEVERAVAEVVRVGGRIDVLVNCASATRAGSALTLTDQEWVTGFEVKVFGTLRMIRAAWPHLVETGGDVVNIGGIGARTPRDAFAMTGALSASVMALTKVFADRGISDGVRVNMINPGAVLTPRIQTMLRARAENQGRALEQVQADMITQDRITRLGTPQDVAELVAFLLGDGAGWMHGAIVDIDGGRTKSI